MIEHWAPFVIGLAMTLSFAYRLVQYLRFRIRAVAVPGLVVDLKKSSNANYHPILEFVTAEGREVRARMRAGSRPAPARRGQRVTVVYDPHKPAEAEIANKGWIRWGLFVLMILVGVVLLLFGLFWGGSGTVSSEDSLLF